MTGSAVSTKDVNLVRVADCGPGTTSLEGSPECVGCSVNVPCASNDQWCLFETGECQDYCSADNPCPTGEYCGADGFCVSESSCSDAGAACTTTDGSSGVCDENLNCVVSGTTQDFCCGSNSSCWFWD